MSENAILAIVVLGVACLFVLMLRSMGKEDEKRKAEEGAAFEAECQDLAARVEREANWRAERASEDSNFYMVLMKQDILIPIGSSVSRGPDDSPSELDVYRRSECSNEGSYIAMWAHVYVGRAKSALISCTDVTDKGESFGMAQKTVRIAEILRSKGFETNAASGFGCPPERHFNRSFPA